MVSRRASITATIPVAALALVAVDIERRALREPLAVARTVALPTGAVMYDVTLGDPDTSAPVVPLHVATRRGRLQSIFGLSVDV